MQTKPITGRLNGIDIAKGYGQTHTRDTRPPLPAHIRERIVNEHFEGSRFYRMFRHYGGSASRARACWRDMHPVVQAPQEWLQFLSLRQRPLPWTARTATYRLSGPNFPIQDMFVSMQRRVREAFAAMGAPDPGIPVFGAVASPANLLFGANRVALRMAEKAQVEIVKGRFDLGEPISPSGVMFATDFKNLELLILAGQQRTGAHIFCDNRGRPHRSPGLAAIALGVLPAKNRSARTLKKLLAARGIHGDRDLKRVIYLHHACQIERIWSAYYYSTLGTPRMAAPKRNWLVKIDDVYQGYVYERTEEEALAAARATFSVNEDPVDPRDPASTLTVVPLK